MDTEIKLNSSDSRRGVAMFVVLGAIVLVTLFGYVGLTLAGKDQTLSGDSNDIKNRDEAAFSGLQIAINRLVAQPDTMLKVLNSFIDEGFTNQASPSKSWFNLASTSMDLLGSEPDWFALATGNDQTAVKVRLLGIARTKDTSGSVEENIDNDSVYVSLLCKARGRHGDEKIVQGSYLVHGLSNGFKHDTSYYTVPRHSFYLGGNYASPNMGLSTTGDVYIGGTGESFMNSGANHVIGGDLQFNGNMKMNKGNPVVVNGNLYVPGWFKNNGDSLRVNGNAWLGGFDGMDDPGTVYVKGNMHIHNVSTGDSNDVWNSAKGLRVDGNLVYFPFNARIPKKLVVGGDAWFVRGTSKFNINASDSFYIGRSLYLGQPTMAHRYVVEGAGLFKVGASLYHAGPIDPKTFLTLPGGVIGQELKIDQKLTIAAGRTLSVGANYQINNLQLGAGASITGTSAAPTGSWTAPPTDIALGLNPAKTNTQQAQNPMDSVKTPSDILTRAIPIGPLLPGGKLTGLRLTAMYDSLKNARRLYNGYMILTHRDGDGWLDANDGTSTFTGKMMIIIEGSMTVGGNWPASSSLASIQVILVRKKGNLGEFGWPDTLAGIISWENPCGGRTFKITRGFLYGALLMGTTLLAPGYGYTQADVDACPSHESSLTTNSGDLRVIRDLATFEDIGRNLPGVLMPALDAAGNSLTTRSSIFSYKLLPVLRLVHNSPSFEPVGVFR